MVAFGLVLILGALSWAVSQYIRPAETTQSSPEAEGNYPDVARVSLADAKAAYDTGGAIFVDVRDQVSYEQRHIPGALSIPLGELPDRIGELNKSAWIITY
jgi:3-mercaptopyruvate sulfurtransferase SseA